MLNEQSYDVKPAGDLTKLKKNPVVKIMQAFWGICAKNDKKTHSRQTPPEDVIELKDIQYAGDDEWHLLDVYYPDDIDAERDKLPVIIDIHGGGWMYATKELNEYYCLSLAEQGYTVFSMNYRLVPDVTVNLQLSDIMTSIEWIFNHLSDFPADSRKIMLTGDSAGGQLASYAAILMQSEELRKVFDIESENRHINALVLTSPVVFMESSGLMKPYTERMWGTDFKNSKFSGYMDLSNILHFAKQFPPTYLITSSGDILARGQTHRLYDVLKKENIECEIADYPAFKGKSLPHVFSVLDPFDEMGSKANRGALDFYKKILDNNCIL